MARRLTSTVIGAVAFLLGLATAILMVILAGSLISDHQKSYAFPLAAAVIQFLSNGSLAVLIYRRTRYDQILAPQTGQTLLPILLLGVLPSLVAIVNVGAALGWAEAGDVGKALPISKVSASTFLTIILIVWGFSIGAHVLCYSYFAWSARSSQKRCPQIYAIEGPLDEAPQEMREASQSVTGTTIESNPFHQQLSSSLPSLIASDGTSSLRSSFSTTQRPSSSRRGLLTRQPSYTRQSQRSSLDGPMERPSQDESFDWDTSGVSSQIRETVFQSKPMMKGSGLPPIPGSRSPSPAKALEGPFFQSSPSLTPPASPLPQPTVSRPNSPPSSPSELPNFTTMFPPSSNPAPTSPHQRNFSRPGSRSGPISRSGTISHSRPESRPRAPSEDHIHPLFRTCSPGPSPGASPGTIVTAAPEAGLLIDESILKRMRSRSGSLPSSPIPLVRSESSPEIVRDSFSTSQHAHPMPNLARIEPSPGHPKMKRSASFQSSVDGLI
ncbi:hypothetical protein BDR22DRAFT_885299 [Usnea florida]